MPTDHFWILGIGHPAPCGVHVGSFSFKAKASRESALVLVLALFGIRMLVVLSYI